MPNRAAPGSPLTAEQRRQIGNATGFTFDSSDGNSIYHAVQVRLTRRFRRGISANALYTFSKSIDNVSTLRRRRRHGGGAERQGPARRARAFQLRPAPHAQPVLYADIARRRRLARSADPRLRGRACWQDWTLSGGMTARSGIAVHRAGAGQPGQLGRHRRGGQRARGCDRPAGVAAAPGSSTCAPSPCLPAGLFGNAGRNTIPGPGHVSMNASFGRGLPPRRAAAPGSAHGEPTTCSTT